MFARVAVLAAAAVLALAGEAAATYPGAPGGKLAFSARIGADTSNEIYTYDLDAQVLQRLTDAPGDDIEPSWNPDGTEIVFASNREDAATLNCSIVECDYDLYTVTADGSSETRLTTTPITPEREPAWSPDGARIAFTSSEHEELIRGVYVMDADGSDRERLFGAISAEDQAIEPDWSPDGDRIAFNDRFARIWVGNADGTGARYIGDGSEPNWSPYRDFVLVTGDDQFSLGALSADQDLMPVFMPGPQGQLSPVWSPDMGRIAVVGAVDAIHLMNADGSSRQEFLVADGPIIGLDWLALPTTVPGYVRPKQASRVRVPLVPAFEECVAPNRQHGPPLAFGSCNPPVQKSSAVTVGTPDANGRPANSVGSVTIGTVVGNPGTDEDEADIALRLELSDVRRTSDLADYTGNLVVPLPVQITDRNNGCCPVGGPYAATGAGADVEFGATCTPTPDPDEGAGCTTSTSLDAITPAAVREGVRTTVQVGQIEVFPQAGGGPLAVQGVFVP
jgi:Tol biopolymer transport system component